MTTARDVWEGKPVTFVEFTIKEGRAAREAFARDSEDGAIMLVVLSMRWADTGERVFATFDEAEAQPFRLRATLMRLSTKAAFVNGLRGDDPEAPPTAGSNGHDAQAAASPPS